MNDGEFSCEKCGGVFQFGWSEEEALDEMEQNFNTRDTSGMSVICDDCYKELMAKKSVQK